MDRIALGSGELYVMLYSGTIPQDSVIEAPENLLGAISGGASLEYTVSGYDAVDDSGKRSKHVITEEKALLKSGVMTWNGLTLRKLASTARVTESGGKRTVKIGGIGNQNGEKYLIRFLHKDEADGDCRLTIVGTNQAGLSIAFAKDKETVINAEFAAMPHADGTLIIYEEDIIPEQSLMVTSVAGATSGYTELTVTPAKAAGNSYKYRTGAYIDAPAAGDTLTDYTAWDGTAEIETRSGYTVIVAEVDSGGTCVKYGSVTAVVAE